MSAKHAVLGLLMQRQSYPYELSLMFKERIGPGWEMNRGQVYQMVERLEREGLVERVQSKPSPRGPRWTYRPTERGEQEFEHWFMGRSEKVRPLRDDLFIKVALSQPKHANHLLEAIARQEMVCMDRLREYSELEPSLDGAQQSKSWDRIWPNLMLKAAVTHLHTEITWLREVRAQLKELIASGLDIEAED